MRRGICVGFTGAGGTGKTSTAKVVCDKTGIPFLPSSSRMVYEKKDLTEEKVLQMTPEEKWKLQREILGTKLRVDDITMNFISDRTLLDHWAYCLLYCAASMSDTELFETENLVRKHMLSSYSHIFYFPQGYWKPESDGVRQDSDAWQVAIDALLLGHFSKWGIQPFIVPQDRGPEVRAQFILDVLSGKAFKQEEK